ncbi:MAG: glycosyltransferase [Dehalococcoidales bacterium]|nr:glycosyltransferase [Dehalococcoidales bacterium]
MPGTEPARPDVSAVIVSRNQRELLVSALSSLYSASQGLVLEAFLVDNNSSDGTPNAIRTLFPEVEITLRDENLGFAKANNLSLRKARGRYILLLNPDTYVQAQGVRTVVEFMDRHPEVGICGPKVVLPNGRLDAPCKRSFKTPSIYFYKATGLSSLFPRSRRFGKYYLSYLDEDQMADVDSVMGAFLMIRQETIRDIGLLDERFFMYAEEEDWCFRAKKAGWKVVYNPQAAVVHYRAGGTAVHPARIAYEWHKSAFLFHRKSIASSYPFAVNVAIYLGIGAGLLMKITRIFLLAALSRKRNDIIGDRPTIVAFRDGSVSTHLDQGGQ